MDIDQGVQAAEKAEPAGNHAWYLIYTKPNAEYQVDHHLAEQGLDTYLPTVRSARPRRGHTTEPLFPGYLFVRADWSSTPLSLVRWTPGVRRVVSFGGRPAVVPDRVIAYIRQRIAALNAGGGFGPGHLRPGDAVRIVEGPLAGLEAVFEKPLSAGERARVLIAFIGQMNRAEVPIRSLQKIKRRRRTRGHGRRIRQGRARVGPQDVAFDSPAWPEPGPTSSRTL